jgi:TonB family protein
MMTPIGVAAAMVLAGQATIGPTPRGDPKLWITSNDYPAMEHPPRREIVGVRLDVGEDGRVKRCLIVESSGSAEFDRTTCSRLRTRARFHPARNAGGLPVPGRYRLRVRWRLPD